MWIQGTYHWYLTAILWGLYVKQFIPVMVKMVQTGTSWIVLNQIFQDAMIFLGIELFILNRLNPVFFEKVVDTIEGFWK